LIKNVVRVANEILADEPTIDVLINNAVVLPPERIITEEGLELSHATNLVAPFALTDALIPRMVESSPSRIINVISGGMYTETLDVDDLNYEDSEYRGTVAYARAKRGLMVLTKLWADQLAGSGVTVNATHPGWVDTPGVKDSLPGFHRLMRPLLRSPKQGADTIMWLAASPDVASVSGKLWHDRAARTEYRLRKTRETAEDRSRLWDELTRTVAEITEPVA
jgi:dehydrogenase/reductase SDR family protein 12